jgi:catalase
MTESKLTLNRRQLLAGAGGISLIGAVDPSVAAATAAPGGGLPHDIGAVEKTTEASAETVIDALEGVYGVNRGQRRNHTKGVGALGYFVGLPEAAVYSRSPLFSGETLQVVARFSLAGGDPHASDTERSPRGLGLQFRLPTGGLHHMTMLHTPMFFANMPKTFLDKFLALKPDPLTGKPDPVKYQEFLGSHPDNAAQAHFLADANPPVSYANAAYYGIHTFKFIDRGGKVTMVRFRFVPQDGERQLSKEQMKFMPHNFLNQTLIQRTLQGPVRWDMIVTVGEPGDPETDPTLLWPPGRKEFKAGTLILTSASPDTQAGSYNVNYDPLIMSDGIAATDDPILLFRSPTYALSFTRRIRNI